MNVCNFFLNMKSYLFTNFFIYKLFYLQTFLIGRYYFLPNEYEKSLIFNTDSAGSSSGFSIQIEQITDCSKPWRPGNYL